MKYNNWVLRTSTQGLGSFDESDIVLTSNSCLNQFPSPGLIVTCQVGSTKNVAFSPSSLLLSLCITMQFKCDQGVPRKFSLGVLYGKKNGAALNVVIYVVPIYSWLGINHIFAMCSIWYWVFRQHMRNSTKRPFFPLIFRTYSLSSKSQPFHNCNAFKWAPQNFLAFSNVALLCCIIYGSSGH